MALSANTEPHFTTIADFISASGQEVIDLFLEVLLICDVMGLIGEEMFVVDGVKLPLNASKEWSGTREDLQKKKEKAEYYGEVNFYRPQRDFTISEDKTHCICPAGKRLYCNGGNVIVNGNQAV